LGFFNITHAFDGNLQGLRHGVGNMDVWLASNSTRRHALLVPLFPSLHHQGLEGVDETPPHGTVEHQVRTICQRKAAALPSSDHSVIIVADTMLSDPDDHSLSMGKPLDLAHAATMLHRLAGRFHQVWTATSVRWNGSWHHWCESAVVSIPELTTEQLQDLLISKSWEGKAGGYDLAGPMGAYARLVEGAESTVLGLAGEAMQFLEVLASTR
jgi:septum formation protein|tara:strand:- start:1824 stop:2459 length:636 start_codon:yes stop_codon:yes gene_type:complete